MRAVVLDSWGGELAVDEVPAPEPGPGEVAVDVEACLVTRTVENAIQGGLSDDPDLTPRIPGHEFAGVVTEVGAGVETLAVGDRILAYFYLTCVECAYCRRGEQNRCTEFDGWLGVQRDGAYAEKAVIPTENALPLPDGATFAEGAVAADGLATPLHVCDRASVDDTDTVLVIGAAGRIGIHVCQVAAMRGAHVLALDTDEQRLGTVEQHTPDSVAPVLATGTDGTVPGPHLAQRIQDAAPWTDGPTVVIDTVGDQETLGAAWEALGMGGRVVTLTTHHQRSLDVPLADYVVTEASLVGSRYATPDEVVRAARLFADGRLDCVTSGTGGLEDAPSVHQHIRAGEQYGAFVLEP